MAEGEDTAKGDPTKEAASLSSDQNTFPIFETPEIKQEVSSSIPGFPPLFQFAKLQTEASSWTTNASDNSSISTYEFEEKKTMIKTEPSTTNEVIWEENSFTTNLSATNGADPSISGESSGLGSVSKMHEDEMAEAEDNETDQGEEKVGEEATANDEPDEEEAESDPYFYTKRDEFTSEIYKIELQNLPKKCGYKVKICIECE